MHNRAAKDDWGLHNADHLGFPYHNSGDDAGTKSKGKNAKPEGPSSSAKPVSSDPNAAASASAPVVASAPDTATNISPARPAE
jgi:hypothetical protein